MNKLSTILTVSISAALAGTAIHAQTVEQQAERTYEQGKQTAEHAYQEAKGETKETYREGKQEVQQAWQEAKEETRDAAQSVERVGEPTRTAAASDGDREELREDAQDAREQVAEATKVAQEMNRDPQLSRLLSEARGVFIMPSYGKAAAVVGGRGGEGVLLLSNNGKWSNPAFYNFGRGSIGVQAGAAAGSVAMVLMSDKAVSKFRNDDNWALDATAGLTIVNYSADARGSANRGDVIVWSNNAGLFAGASIGVSNISRDDTENAAYYSQDASPQEIFSGTVKNSHAQALQDALPQVASR